MFPDVQVSTPAFLISSLMDGSEIIKTSNVSDVYRAQWLGRDVVVKRYNHMGFVHSLRHSVKGSRARRSWRNGLRLLELGIPTPCPIAHIDEYRGPLLWRSYLVTEAVDGRRLGGLLADEMVSSGTKRRIIHQVLKWIGRLSAHGISHGDMKHTNILCADSRVVLTDLDGVETHEWEWLHRQRRAVDMARFLRDIAGEQMQGYEVDALTGQPVDAQAARRQEFAARDSADGVLNLNGDLCDRELEEAIMAGHEAIRTKYASTSVESSQHSHVLRFQVTSESDRRTLYYKEYLPRSPLDRLKELLRPCRAMRAFHASLLLSDAGFLSPTVAAAGQVGGHSVLVTEEATDALPAYKYLAPPHGEGSLCTLQERRELLRSLGRTIGRMHREGIVHGDLRPGNILVRKAAGGWEFFFLDNERTRRPYVLWPFLRRKNLVQINMLPTGLSRTDRMRFFHTYMLLNPSVCLHHKQWARDVMTITRRRLSKKGWVI